MSTSSQVVYAPATLTVSLALDQVSGPVYFQTGDLLTITVPSNGPNFAGFTPGPGTCTVLVSGKTHKLIVWIGDSGGLHALVDSSRSYPSSIGYPNLDVGGDSGFHQSDFSFNVHGFSGDSRQWTDSKGFNRGRIHLWTNCQRVASRLFDAAVPAYRRQLSSAKDLPDNRDASQAPRTHPHLLPALGPRHWPYRQAPALVGDTILRAASELRARYVLCLR